MRHIEGVGERIRKRMQTLGYWKHDRPDVRRFCEELGYTTQYLYGWLRGRTPSFAYVTRLAADLRVSVEWLAFGHGEATAAPAPPAKRTRTGDTRASPLSDVSSPQVAHRTKRPDHARIERGQVIEHPLARIGALMERLEKSEAELQSTVDAWRSSEERFRKIFEDGPLGMVIFDPAARIVEVNQRFADMLGYPSAEMVGRPVLDFCHPVDASEGKVAIDRVLSGDTPFVSAEMRYVRCSGEVIWCQITSIVVRSEPAPYGVKMVQDVTERKVAEERLQSLVAGAPIGLYRSAPEGDFLDANPAMVQILGAADRDGLLAINSREFYVDLADRGRWLDLLDRQGIVRDFEKKLRRRDGAIIWARDSARAIRGPDGRVVFWEGVLEDITARKHAEEATRAMAEVGGELAGTLDLARASAKIAAAVLGLLDVPRSVLFQLDRERDVLVCVAAAGAGDHAAWLGRSVPASAGVAGLALRERRPAWSPDLASDPRFSGPEWIQERVAAEDSRSGLAVPLIAGGEALGVLSLGDARGRAFSEEEVGLLSAFADRAALALQAARLYEEAQQRRREAEVLADLAGRITASLDLGAVLQAVAAGAKDLCGADLARIALLERGSGAMLTRYWDGARSSSYPTLLAEPGKGSGGVVLLTGRPFRTKHYESDTRISKDYLDVARSEGIIADMVVPIQIDQRVEGLLYVDQRSPRVFSDRDEAILLRLADYAAIAIRNARLFEDAERRRRAAESLAGVAHLVSQSLDAEEVGQRVADSVRQLLGTAYASVMRLEPSGDLRVVASSGYAAPVLERNFVVPRGTYVVGAAVRERRAVSTSDIAGEPLLTLTAEDRARLATVADRAVLAVPLTVKGRAIGALSVRDRTGRVFEAEEARLAQVFADQAALALENARLFEEAERRRKAAQSLAELGRLMSESLDPVEVGHRIVESLLALLRARTTALYALEPGSGNLVALTTAGDVDAGGEWELVLVPGTGVVGLSVQERQAVFTRNLLADSRAVGGPEASARMEPNPSTAVLGLPLLRKGMVVGALGVGDRSGREFTDEEILLAEAFADRAVMALENARLFAETRSQRDRLLARSSEWTAPDTTGSARRP